MSEMGLVSRVSPVHTAVCNCTRDEGGPFEVGNQVLISSHRKLAVLAARRAFGDGTLADVVLPLACWNPAQLLHTDATGETSLHSPLRPVAVRGDWKSEWCPTLS